MGSKIGPIAYYLPTSILDNDELYRRFPDYAPNKILKKLGIQKRHWAAPNETALDMAKNAAGQLLQNYDPTQVDFLLFCTQSPDYLLPTGACILQHQLGLPQHIGALDYNLGCSGFVYGLAVAKGLISGNIAKNVLLVTAETYTKHLNPADKGNMAIFGDGAAAVIVEAAGAEQIGQFVLGTDGAGAQNLIVKNGLMRHPKDGTAGDYLTMNGPEIFNFTIAALPGLIEQTLQKNQLDISEIDCFVFHQANRYMLEYLREKIGIAPERFLIDMEDGGNTVSSTIPMVLHRALASGQIKRGDRLLLAGFGVGYSYGATVVKI